MEKELVLINLSNHPSANWDEEQKREFLHLELTPPGSPELKIIDVPFPNVDPNATLLDIMHIAIEIVKELEKYNYRFIMVQGEHTLTYQIVKELVAYRKKPVAATTQRIVTEKDGVKTSIFKFVKFRQYNL